MRNSATSASAPGLSVPTSSCSPITCAGRAVAAWTVSAKLMPSSHELAEAGGQVEHGPVDAELVDVRRDDVRPVARGHQRLGRLERERARAVADVHDDAAVPDPPGLVPQPALVVDDAHVPAGEAVGQDVARPHVAQDLGQGGRPPADVDHERHFAPVGGLPGALQGCDAGAARGVPIDARLDAEHDVPVQIDQPAAEVDVAVVQVGELEGRRGQADRRDVEQRIDARRGWPGDELTKPGKL